jgi:branched-subunit amino acid transport protein
MVGVVAAGLAAWRTRNLIVAVVVGMVVRWVLMAWL